MKKYLIIIILSYFSLEAIAQQIGTFGNLIISDMHSSYRSNPNYGGEAIFSSSFGIDYHFNREKKIDYVLSLTYERKGDNYNQPTLVETFRVNYLTLKGMTKFGNSDFDVQVGPYVGFLTFVDKKPDNQSSDLTELWTHKVDLGMSMSLNQYLFGFDKMAYYLRGEVNYGLTNVVGSGGITTDIFLRNFTYGLGLAVRWNYKY